MSAQDYPQQLSFAAPYNTLSDGKVAIVSTTCLMVNGNLSRSSILLSRYGMDYLSEVLGGAILTGRQIVRTRQSEAVKLRILFSFEYWVSSPS